MKDDKVGCLVIKQQRNTHNIIQSCSSVVEFSNTHRPTHISLYSQSHRHRLKKFRQRQTYASTQIDIQTDRHSNHTQTQILYHTHTHINIFIYCTDLLSLYRLYRLYIQCKLETIGLSYLNLQNILTANIQDHRPIKNLIKSITQFLLCQVLWSHLVLFGFRLFLYKLYSLGTLRQICYGIMIS